MADFEFRISKKRRAALERVLREHYQPQKVMAEIATETSAGRFFWLSDAGVVELASQLGRKHRHNMRMRNKIRALESA